MYCGKIISRRTMKKKEGDEERHINYHHYTHTTENNKEKAAVCLRRISYLLLLSTKREISKILRSIITPKQLFVCFIGVARQSAAQKDFAQRFCYKERKREREERFNIVHKSMARSPKSLDQSTPSTHTRRTAPSPQSHAVACQRGMRYGVGDEGQSRARHYALRDALAGTQHWLVTPFLSCFQRICCSRLALLQNTSAKSIL